MKRYWKISLLSIAVVVVLGTYFLQSSLAAKNDINIKFEKISGDDAELNDLVIYGDFQLGDIFQSFKQVSEEETVFFNNQSFLEQLLHITANPVLTRLIDEHRNFMRGKELITNNFYEDENLLAYATINSKNPFSSVRSFSFEMEVLNKKSNETVKIEYDIPEKERVSWIEVVNVEVINEQVKVMTQNSLLDGGSKISVYTFDLKEKNFVNKEEILSTSNSEDRWEGLRAISDYSSIEAKQYVLMLKENSEIKQIEENGYYYQEEEMIAKEQYVLNVETNEYKEIKKSDEELRFDSAVSVGSSIYVPVLVEKGFELHHYDIEKDEWSAKEIFNRPDMKNGFESSFLKLMNGKFYLTYLSNDGHILFIGDMKTGKTLYEGKLKVDSANYSEDSLNIHDIE
ncbi:hypothetical protein PZE06_18465 [Robertmurraya sp. DFI.2.37]|uniref:hypothetical protein n=1 Tax=Robertmurraya sp. DFI.2.37 TaxID=3031819 RepID=UPI0023DC7507|nr:hypothetical protein [Robertmurraya sp. DFI.2.37]MDF1510122.1 hypothetical protein [Robertmurraya sp. DFI.2.37]